MSKLKSGPKLNIGLIVIHSGFEMLQIQFFRGFFCLNAVSLAHLKHFQMSTLKSGLKLNIGLFVIHSGFEMLQIHFFRLFGLKCR